MTVNDRLTTLRGWMREEKIDAYIIPSSDPHQSEYVAEHWKSREWISGFTGSAGTVVVTVDYAGVWTDSRYFLQGEMETASSEFELQKMHNQFGNYYRDWIIDNLSSGQTVAVDGQLFSNGQCDMLKKAFVSEGLKFRIDADGISPTWTNRAAIPMNEIYVHDAKYAGKTRTERLNEVRAKMVEQKADHHLTTTLDDIGWTLNIRGTDIDFNPVAVCYLVVSKTYSTLFIDKVKVPVTIQNELKADNIYLRPYTEIVAYLNQLPEIDTLLVDPLICNAYLYRAINAKKVNGNTPAKYLKAIKNSTEIAHSKSSQIKDSVGMAKAWKWLEDTLKSRNVSEAEFADKLAECRGQQAHYKSESFPAIIGYKGNGAIIHYHPTHDACHDIKNNGMLLCDSGGQYLDGTTDITRTVSFTDPTDQQKLHYTLVLKGMIGLSMAKFPIGTQGNQLDTLARMHLWQHGLNYGHGTGHGVGFFMNVHEPPQGFAPGNSMRSNTKHDAGMLSSNEPGYYLEGEYGIRIENLMVVVEDKEGWLKFDTITLFPIATNLIDMDFMTTTETQWLNDYHQETYDKVSPQMDEEHRLWLKEKCRAL